MAATKGSPELIAYFPYVIESCKYTTLVAGVTVTHTLKNQINVKPFKVELQIDERPTSRDPVFLSVDDSAWDSTADANTIALQFDTIPGGDLTGAEVRVLIYHLAQASGGISA